MDKSDIVIISSSRWDDLWTRKQRLASYLCKREFRVLYLEPPETFGLSQGISKNFCVKIFSCFKKSRRINNNLLVTSTPFLIPGALNFYLINFIYQVIFYFYIKKELKILKAHKVIILDYLPYIPLVIKWLSKKNKIIYDIVDNFSEMRGFLINPYLVEKLERKLLKNTDICVVTNKLLLNKFKPIAKNIFLIPNGVDFLHFNQSHRDNIPEPDDLKFIPHPRIGFVGTIQYWLDYDLLRNIGKKNPHCFFVFMGPILYNRELEKIQGLKNFFFLGKKDYKNLPSYLKYLDVLILPFKQSGIAKSASPLKLYEYLATGKPIVSTHIIEVENLKDIVYVAQDEFQFSDFIQIALKEYLNQAETQNRRINYAQQADWQNRFREFKTIISDIL